LDYRFWHGVERSAILVEKRIATRFCAEAYLRLALLTKISRCIKFAGMKLCAFRTVGI